MWIFFFCLVSISNQYYGNVQIDGSLVCGGEAFSFNEAAMICRHLGYSSGLPLPSAKLEITFMIGIKCSGSEESISECNTSSSLCPSVSRWEEKKIGIARVLCYNKSEGSGRYRTLILLKFMKWDLIVSSSKVQKIISVCTCINLLLFNAGLLKFRQC